MANSNPNFIYLSVKAVQREYFPMFTLKTVRKIIKDNMHVSFVGNKLLVRQIEVENYLSSLQKKDSTVT